MLKSAERTSLNDNERAVLVNTSTCVFIYSNVFEFALIVTKNFWWELRHVEEANDSCLDQDMKIIYCVYALSIYNQEVSIIAFDKTVEETVKIVNK